MKGIFKSSPKNSFEKAKDQVSRANRKPGATIHRKVSQGKVRDFVDVNDYSQENPYQDGVQKSSQKHKEPDRGESSQNLLQKSQTSIKNKNERTNKLGNETFTFRENENVPSQTFYKQMDELKIEGKVNDWLLTDLMTQKDQNRGNKKFKKQQMQRDNALQKKIDDTLSKQENRTQTKWGDYIPYANMLFQTHYQKPKNSHTQEGTEIPQPYYQSKFSQSNKEDLKNQLLMMKGRIIKEEERDEGEKSYRNEILPYNEESQNNFITIQASKIKLSQAGIDPDDLYAKLQEMNGGQKHKRIRSRKDQMRMIDAPSEMWHMDTDLLDVDLDEMVEKNKEKVYKEKDYLSKLQVQLENNDDIGDIDPEFLNIENDKSINDDAQNIVLNDLMKGISIKGVGSGDRKFMQYQNQIQEESKEYEDDNDQRMKRDNQSEYNSTNYSYFSKPQLFK